MIVINAAALGPTCNIQYHMMTTTLKCSTQNETYNVRSRSTLGSRVFERAQSRVESRRICVIAVALYRRECLIIFIIVRVCCGAARCSRVSNESSRVWTSAVQPQQRRTPVHDIHSCSRHCLVLEQVGLEVVLE